MQGSHHLTLLFAPCCVAAAAARTALYPGRRLPDNSGPVHRLWPGAGALGLAIHAPGVAADDNLLRGDWMHLPATIAVGLFLLVALGVVLQSFRTQEMERRRREQRAAWVSEAAQKDRLTGFSNRHHFESLLGEKIAGRGAVEPFTLVSVELDRYRELVRRKGEKAADGMVRAVAAALIRCLPNSIYSRSSSGRFLVITRALEQQEILSVINELKDRLTVSEDAREYGNFSLGHAHYPSSASSSRMLIELARRRRRAVDLSGDKAPG